MTNGKKMREVVQASWTTVRSPVGPITVASLGDAVIAAAFGAGRGALAAELARRPERLALEEGDPAGVGRAIAAYFAGEHHALSDVSVDASGTRFQHAVWEALRRIPAGEVRTYAALAREVGSPAAVRAVGAACARNPVALFVPCHRAVGSGGELRGYAFGLHRKRWLLEHESGQATRSGLRATGRVT
jgi:methylated-DNA-[protein]-cysteine S-methyltransferase